MEPGQAEGCKAAVAAANALHAVIQVQSEPEGKTSY